MARGQAVEPVASLGTEGLPLVKAALMHLVALGHDAAVLGDPIGQRGPLLPVVPPRHRHHGGRLPVTGHGLGEQGGALPVVLAGVAWPPKYVDVIARLQVMAHRLGGTGPGAFDNDGRHQVGNRRRRGAGKAALVDEPRHHLGLRVGQHRVQRRRQHQPRRAGEHGRQAGAAQHRRITLDGAGVQLHRAGVLAGLAQLQGGIGSGHACLGGSGVD
ncbi:hypothetical protein D3C80_1107510 [compost metagenome]